MSFGDGKEACLDECVLKRLAWRLTGVPVWVVQWNPGLHPAGGGISPRAHRGGRRRPRSVHDWNWNGGRLPHR